MCAKCEELKELASMNNDALREKLGDINKRIDERLVNIGSHDKYLGDTLARIHEQQAGMQTIAVSSFVLGEKVVGDLILGICNVGKELGKTPEQTALKVTSILISTLEAVANITSDIILVRKLSDLMVSMR